MVCMTSSTGVMADCARLDFAIQMPSGMPRLMQSNVATEMMASVAMVSSHMPK